MKEVLEDLTPQESLLGHVSKIKKEMWLSYKVLIVMN